MGAVAEGGSYMAFYTDKAPGRVLLYTASVTDLGPEATKGMTPRERLTAFTYAFQKDEVSRTQIEHGSRKLPGLEIVKRSEGKVWRQVLVASGSRIFEVSVTAPTHDDLATREVTAFFESFAVDEYRLPPNPQYQRDPRPPAGHTFYETRPRKAV
jgi:hypothetical protein